jgi:hypothetical protein
MRLFSIKDLVCVAVVFLLMPSLNCQRIKSIPTLFEPTHPPLVRLASEDYPVFSDTVDRDNLIRALKDQISYFARLKKPAQYAFGRKSISSETIRITLVKKISTSLFKPPSICINQPAKRGPGLSPSPATTFL